MADGRAGAGAVIDEKLLRDCIYIEGNVRPGLGEDAVHGKSSSGPSFAVGGRGKAGGGRSAAAGALVSAQSNAPVREMELHEVTALMLSYRKIGTIANLVGVDKLVKLHLDNNNISTIENLGHLRHLKWLDLSFNRITAITGLENLTELEDLSLHRNQISVVEGLDAQRGSLTCLSLGRNEIPQEVLDDVGKYLHKFKKLRMLSLAGNKIDQQSAYRLKLLGYINGLRFLDSRAVLESDVAKARDELRGTIMSQDDEDKQEEERADQERKDADEATRYRGYNCPNENRFRAEIAGVYAEGRNMQRLLDFDFLRDRIKDIIDPYNTDFDAKTKALADKMKEIKQAKDTDFDDYQVTLARAKTRCDLEGKETIRAFEKQLKKVIPHGIRAKREPELRDDTEEQVELLLSRLDDLRTALLELEADQQDMFDSLNKAFEDALENHKVAATETLNVMFEDIRQVEKKMYNDMSHYMKSFFDDKERDKNEPESFNTGLSENDPDAALAGLLDSREEFAKAFQDWHEKRTNAIDQRMELHVKHEEESFKALIERLKEAEHKRNRWRVCEIAKYHAHTRDELQRWLATNAEGQA